MTVKNLLIDIDGVFRLGERKIIPGALEALQYIKRNKINHLFVSNGTRACRETVAKQLQGIGLDIREEEIFTAPVATALYIKSKKPETRIFLIAEGDTQKDFEQFGISVTRKEEIVDFVVIGYDRELDYRKLTFAFRALINGAEMVAMNVDKRFRQEDGLLYPATVFAAAGLEASTGKEPVVIGKPRKPFFEAALKELKAKKESTIMIGDSIEGDIAGAKKLGIKTILVKTGSYSKTELEKSPVKPDYMIDSIKDFPDVMERIK